MLPAYAHQYHFPWTPVGTVQPLEEQSAGCGCHRQVLTLWARKRGLGHDNYQFAVPAPYEVADASPAQLLVVMPARGSAGWLSCGEVLVSRVNLRCAFGTSHTYVVRDIAPERHYCAPAHVLPACPDGEPTACDWQSYYHRHPYGAVLRAPPRGSVGYGRWDAASNSKPASGALLAEYLLKRCDLMNCNRCHQPKTHCKCHLVVKKKKHHRRCCDTTEVTDTTTGCGCESTVEATSSCAHYW